MATSQNLGKGVSTRQITMISIGGVIGAGLFVGSSNAIATAGPAVLISYLIAAIIVILVMQMLGEMATSRPDTGSFSSYADEALGRWAGFTIGWLYWWFYVLVIAIEAIAAGNILSQWLPLPAPICALLMTTALIVTNCLHVKNYGKLEYWLSFVKVASIVVFLVLGVVAMLGLMPHSSVNGIQHLWADGGFLPKGSTAILTGLLVAMFSFQGSEIVTIAAAESEDPRNNIKRAIKAVVWRLGLFYLGSMFVVIALVPWNDPKLTVGSYQAVLSAMNIPYAAGIMQAVVLVAVTSCLNSSIYVSSRMVYSLAKRGDCMKSLAHTTQHGVPLKAILATSVIVFGVIVVNYAMGKDFFMFLLSTSGAVVLLMYLVIAITQLYMRKKMVAMGETPIVKMWLFPYLNYITIVGIICMMGLMTIFPESRSELVSTFVLTAILASIGFYLQKRQPQLSSQRHLGKFIQN